MAVEQIKGDWAIRALRPRAGRLNDGGWLYLVSVQRGWTDLESTVRAALSQHEKQGRKNKKPSADEVLSDISTAVQRIEARLSNLEQRKANIDGTLELGHLSALAWVNHGPVKAPQAGSARGALLRAQPLSGGLIDQR